MGLLAVHEAFVRRLIEFDIIPVAGNRGGQGPAFRIRVHCRAYLFACQVEPFGPDDPFSAHAPFVQRLRDLSSERIAGACSFYGTVLRVFISGGRKRRSLEIITFSEIDPFKTRPARVKCFREFYPAIGIDRGRPLHRTVGLVTIRRDRQLLPQKVKTYRLFRLFPVHGTGIRGLGELAPLGPFFVREPLRYGLFQRAGPIVDVPGSA